ncbi:MAG: fibronectin type III domain-containing protein, partial [Planctomycetota bacterium]
YGVFAPSVEDTPAGMTNRYYYHWLLDTDNNPATGYLNDQYEGNPTNLETPIGVELIVQFGWRDGATNGVYAYTLDPLTGDEVGLFEDYEYTIDVDTIHAVIPLEDLGLEPGQTIAVSAFQEGASNGWQCDWIESFELTLEDTSVSAYKPDPEDGAMLMETWANLSWSPDEAAVSHDVYFGDNYGDVAKGTGDTFRVNQGRDNNSYIVGFSGYPYPDGLVPGTTYYWRIDEVNEADPRSPWRGDVWSFSIAPRTAYNPDPPDGTGFVALDATLNWTAGFDAKLHTVYFSDNLDDVVNGVGGSPQSKTTYAPAAMEREKVYYWRVDEFDGTDTHAGNIWAFTTPGAVGNPQPANGAVGVQKIATLSWTAADSAASHELYFGTDADAVRNATTASPEYIGPRALGAESYDPGGLAWDSSYAWRVDEVYPDKTVKGLVWTFTAADFLLVDDFESYDDIDPAPGEPGINRIFDKWIDGFETTTNGALVGNDMPPYAEQGIVHGGAQSMPYRYDNAGKTSEATLTLVWPRDWTEDGVTRLSLWFRGGTANSAEGIAIVLDGTSSVWRYDPAATQTTGWTRWVIDLRAFEGVNLADVNSIGIRIGPKPGEPATGGTGKVYFDDIRLIR